jgi:hypothetical protein
MCPFCIGAAAWAAAGVVSAGGLGLLAAVVRTDRGAALPEARDAGDAGESHDLHEGLAEHPWPDESHDPSR